MEDRSMKRETLKFWRCHSCGKPVIRIVRISTTPDGIADMCKQEFLPAYGGQSEVSRHCPAYWCKECYAHILRVEGTSK